MPSQIFKHVVGGTDLFSLQEFERMANRRAAQVPVCSQKTMKTRQLTRNGNHPVFSAAWVATNDTADAMAKENVLSSLRLKPKQGISEMLTPGKSKTEEKLAESQRKYKQAVTEKESARRKEAEQTASLRALRLAKEAADKDAAEETAAKNWAAKSK